MPKIIFLTSTCCPLWEGAGDVECGGSRASALGNTREGRGLLTRQRKQNMELLTDGYGLTLQIPGDGKVEFCFILYTAVITYT